MVLVRSLTPVFAALVLAAAGPPLVAQEEPVTAGSEGVPAPKKTKHVQPVYPQEALAQGIRGIVILDIVLDKQGKVESANVVRSVPGLDEAAVAAARQWEFTPTKVDGKPVRVRITVPVVFSLALPTLNRQAGIPELRQGVAPAWPAGASSGGLARAEVTLEADGRVGSAHILEGGPPWSEALLAALKTWRFAPPPEDEVMSFRVEAEFVAGGGGRDARKVSLEATGLQRSGLLEGPPASPSAPAAQTAAAEPARSAPAAPASSAPTAGAPAAGAPASAAPAPSSPAPAAQPPAPAAQEPATGQPAPVQQVPAPETPPPAARPTPAQPAPAQPAQATPAPTAPATSAPRQPSRPAPPPQGAAAAPGATADATAPPPVEVITAPPPALPPENGVSAIRDVTLEAGVPDLTRGRRPVAPPLARMEGATGTVEVSFSVGTSGTATVQSVSGPDLLKPAAEQAVASWVFRRTRADRAYLLAVFTYTGDKSSAVVRPQSASPAGSAGPAGSPAPPSDSAPPKSTATPPGPAQP